ncbi:hypothetical protein P12x_003040 [Tundrisphaera lichenicola]|uniref:hypothetical protein n=1 Tax=Tundrisphaera lichenicola TaxID=2029860 RepID=UPI003EBDD77B
MACYYSTTSCDRPRIAPGDLPGAIGVVSDPDARMAIGIAYEAGHVGGWRHDFDRWPIASEYLGKPEAAWRLVIGKEELEGRFVLRSGEFVELAEDAI